MLECLQTKCGRTDSGQRAILKPHLSNQAKNVTSIVKTAPPPWQPCFSTDRDHLRTHLRYIQEGHDGPESFTSLTKYNPNPVFIKINILTKFHNNWMKTTNILIKFHEDWMKTINILTKFHKDWMKTATSIVYTSDLPDFITINILTKFHEDWMKTATSFINILTKFHKDWMKTPTSIVYTSDLINILTKYHKDWMKTVTSTVYTNKLLTDGRTHTQRTPDITRSHKLTMSLRDSHVIQLTGTIFELNSCIKETNKNAPPTGAHVFSPIWTIFNLVRDINKTNVLTNFHDDWANIVTSRVFTRKTAPPIGSHVLTYFELDRDIIGTNLLTKFHADRTINVASRVFTNKCGRTNGRRTKTGHKSSPEQSGELKIG
ncbi:hypothetical protein DPMN_062985 [Dreissena polymorpha]|uniref:Uncharacterized protein n=1 Tax=Dreissena polymorpha TaxID=45954 RepID=A0A9D4HIM7_DREPO|nr:hypothetical protein DPMN_062985 [Dreissena polymorpha]